MSRVLVTGATGFIGRHCLEPLLRRGHEVHGVTIDSTEGFPDQIRWHAVDLLAPGAPGVLLHEVKPSHLLHLAWCTTPGAYWTATANLSWAQVTLELLRRFPEEGGRRVVGAGSCAEYAWGVGDGTCTEGVTPERPATLYGACKKAVHDVAMALQAQGAVQAAWGRVFHLYGPHEHPDRFVPAVIGALLRGQEARCTEGTQVRDLSHVADVGEALVALLCSEVSGAVNIASGQPVALREVAWTIARRIGRPGLLCLGSRPAPPGEPAVLVADVRRLQREVGWCGTRSLEDGLDQTIDWWRARLIP